MMIKEPSQYVLSYNDRQELVRIYESKSASLGPSFKKPWVKTMKKRVGDCNCSAFVKSATMRIVVDNVISAIESVAPTINSDEQQLAKDYIR